MEKLRKREYRDYTQAKLIGAYTEDFLNIIIQNGIEVWDSKKEDGILTFRCRPSDFLIIKPLAEELNMEITESGGRSAMSLIMPRYSLVTGFLSFALAVLLAGNHVWRIDVFGNNVISDQELLAVLSENNITIGTDIRTADRNKIKSEMAAGLRLPNLSWISIERAGSRVNVKTSERTIPEVMPPVPEKIPCNVVASEDGVVTETEVYRGKLFTAKGYAVSKGEILISGVDYQNGQTVLSHASGKVMAECYRAEEFTVPYEALRNKSTGEVTERKYAVFLGNEIPLQWGNEVAGTYHYKDETSVPKIFGFPLPFKLKTAVYSFYSPVKTRLTTEEAAKEIERLADIYEINFLGKAEIISREIQPNPEPDAYKATVRYRYKKDIAVPKEVIVGN
ncbi:sporulation protein YqfD [Clostridia bacterium]|nr:sporulation protein YqfD [Clostridia bacterium]